LEVDVFGLKQRLRKLREGRNYDIGKHPCATCGRELEPEQQCPKCEKAKPVPFIGAEDVLP